MALFEQVDIYCERTEWGSFAEPLNALTNGAFFLAALLVFLSARRKRLAAQAAPAAFVVLIALVGASSLAFHLLAVQWARRVDSLSIAVFVLFYLWAYLRDIARVSRVRSSGFVTLLLLAMAAMIGVGANLPLNGSEQYLGVLGALVLLALTAPTSIAKRLLTLAAAVFLGSVTMRSLDAWACASFPWGTHFLWHLLNGVVCFLAVEAYLRAIVEGPSKHFNSSSPSSCPDRA